MTIIRAYSMLEAKQFDDQRRVIRGMATSPTLDRVGDCVDPFGVTSADSIPMFLYHDSRKTVARAFLGKATAKGIPFEASFPNVTEAGALKERIDEALAMVRYGLITAVSIGFRVLDGAYEVMKGGGIKYLKTEVMELSLVPVPAQPEAVISGFKSMDHAGQHAALINYIKGFDTATRSALGLTRKGVVRLTAPTGAPKPKADASDPLAATGPKRKGIVRLADPPGASGLSKRQPA